MINTIILGHALNVLPQLSAGSVSCVICSPPYWGLRDYGIEPVIWDEKECEHEFLISSQSPIRHKPGETNPGKEAWYKDKGGIGNPNIRCEHEFNEYDSKLLHENRQNLDGSTLGNPKYRKNLHGFGKAKAGFCLKCNAWRGSLGLEPTFELYIKHLCDIFDEVKRVLRKDGTCWVNIGDTYASSGEKTSHHGQGKSTLRNGNINKDEKWNKNTANLRVKIETHLPTKSLCLIPQRFVIEMVNRGWVARNVLIWWKPNCMPSSAKDRFTVDFETVFFFTKSNKALFWTNEKTLECVSKQPLGIKGIEGKDWEWEKLEQPSKKLTPKDFETEWEYRKHIRTGKEYNSKEPYKTNAPGCKKLKLKKVSLWTGHDYWFEQQFEDIQGEIDSRGNNRITYNIKTKNEWHKPSKNAGFLGQNPQGRNKRAVWTIPTSPYPEAHFAVYPEKLIEPMIKAGCPRYVCKKCGKARVKIYRKPDMSKRPKRSLHSKTAEDTFLGFKDRSAGQKYQEWRNRNPNTFIGYTDCGCNAGFEGGIVIDPFMGAGTTALAALKQRKRFIGIEIKQEYIDMANKRIARVQQGIF